jgi:hypothetical protein
MNRPSDALEKEFNDAGIFFLEQKTLSDPFFEGSYIGVKVEIAIVNGSAVLTVPDFAFSIVNRRGVAILMTDWQLIDRDDQKLLTFTASQRLPEAEAALIALAPANLAMTFMDLCFYSGNEAIPVDFKVDTNTKLNPEASPADLGWHLPSRYVDSVIDALGKLNDSVLAGNMEEAILYGVVRKS